MRVPIIWMDARLRQFAAAFRSCFSTPQHRYFEIVLLSLLLCQEAKTLSALLRHVAVQTSLSGLSRFLALAPWSPAEVVQTWRKRFDTQVAPLVQAEQACRRAALPKHRGRPPSPVVTGYVIGDDSTMHKLRGKKMAGLGKHSSTTAGTQVVGHSLVQLLYVVQGRQCPLEPQLYRQQAVCTAEGVPFRSKIDLCDDQLCTFDLLTVTRMNVLIYRWNGYKRMW